MFSDHVSTGYFLPMPPAASFLSAAKEKRKRNAAKNYVFGFPCAASHGFYLVKISHANIVPRKFHLNIALSLLPFSLPLMLRNVDAAGSTVVEVSGSGAGAETVLLSARQRNISATVWHKPTMCSRAWRAGSLETCGFKQTFWSLLGLWPKVTRAGARNVLCAAERKEAVGDKRERIATPV